MRHGSPPRSPAPPAPLASILLLVYIPTMVYSPFRSAISHAPRKKPTADDPFGITHRPPGSRRPHPDAKVKEVRRLIETTTMTYREISQRTGVPYTNISRWANAGNWTRPLFAP